MTDELQNSMQLAVAKVNVAFELQRIINGFEPGHYENVEQLHLRPEIAILGMDTNHLSVRLSDLARHGKIARQYATGPGNIKFAYGSIIHKPVIAGKPRTKGTCTVTFTHKETFDSAEAALRFVAGLKGTQFEVTFD